MPKLNTKGFKMSVPNMKTPIELQISTIKEMVADDSQLVLIKEIDKDGFCIVEVSLVEQKAKK
jgi:hypothetical protein